MGKLKNDLSIPAHPRSYKSLLPQLGELVFRTQIAAGQILDLCRG
jgi:hypothetical protein